MSFVRSINQQLDRLYGSVSRLPLPNPQTALMIALMLLLMISLLMIASASIPFATSKGLEPLFFFRNQLMYIVFGVIVAIAAYKIPLRYYCDFKMVALAWLMMLILLIASLFTTPINGSSRWLDFGLFNFQPAELCKIIMIMVAAEYTVRRSAEVRESILSNTRLLVSYIPCMLVFLMQPDLGSMVVVSILVLSVLFIGGAPKSSFFGVVFAGLACLILYIAAKTGYHLERIKALLDPFENIQGAGYQQANSLMAYGRGGVTGTGYGDSIQKLAHLPEAHTDFLLAIVGEELGLMGVITVLGLEAIVIICIMTISYRALKRRQLRLAYMSFGFGVLIFVQTMINAGMTLSILPTKGLTMPFFSFGGSSLLTLMIMVGLVFRIAKDSQKIALEKNSAKF